MDPVLLCLFLLFASLSGAVTAVVLAVRGLLAVRRNKGRPRRGWLRLAALLACSGAVTLYVWGMLHVLWAVMDAEDGGTESSPPRQCRERGDQIASHFIGYDVGYIPLRFDCQLDDGTTFTNSAVPGYVNPATALLGLTAVTCGILAAKSGEAAPTPPAGRHDS